MQMEKRDYKIINILNHNTIIGESRESKNTYVFFGKGIGFNKKKGDDFTYNDSIAEALLVLKESQVQEYQDLMNRVQDKKLIHAVQDVVYEANKFFNHVNSNLQITLLDHLNFFIEREKQNISITYPFLNELQYLYPKEYEFSIHALDYINEQMKGIAHFPENELGFIVLHIHAASTDSKVSKVLRNNEMIYDVKLLIEEVGNCKVDTRSSYYIRFLNHLDFAIHRSKNDITIENVLLDSIKVTCAQEYEIAQRIAVMLKKKYRITLDEHEIGYLAVHIYNLRTKK